MDEEKIHRYKGIWPVLITPYNDDLSIDFDGYRQLLEWYKTFDIGGFYSVCQSSEMTELTEEEKLTLISETLKIADGKVPVAATGNFGNNITEHLVSVKRTADAGVDIVMLTVPEFCSNDEELKEYYLRIADETTVKLGIYECPAPRIYNLGLELIEILADSGRFFAYKETSCNLEKINEIIKITKNTDFDYLQANVPYLLESIRNGAPGSMNIASNWLPDLEIKILNLALNNDPRADELQKVLCAMEMVQRSVHPMGVKYLISMRGVPIKPLTRYPRTFSPEEKFSLTRASELWFDDEGSLKILREYQ